MGWQWLVLGALLLGAEMFVVDAQFYLVFMGVASVVVGVLAWAGLLNSFALQWLLFAVLCLATMVGFRRKLYEKIRQPRDSLPDALGIGEHVQLPASLLPGHSCRVEYRGTTWTAHNVDQAELSGEVMIAAVHGLTLNVRAIAK